MPYLQNHHTFQLLSENKKEHRSEQYKLLNPHRTPADRYKQSYQTQLHKHTLVRRCCYVHRAHSLTEVAHRSIRTHSHWGIDTKEERDMSDWTGFLLLMQTFLRFYKIPVMLATLLHFRSANMQFLNMFVRETNDMSFVIYCADPIPRSKWAFPDGDHSPPQAVCRKPQW